MLVSIQIARAIAILGVVVRHLEWIYNDINSSAAPWQGSLIDIGGYGVDLFFCISGFIIGFLLSKKVWTVSDFYVRRLIRIYPFYWAFSILFIGATIVACSVGQRGSCGPYPGFDYIVSSVLLIPQGMTQPPLGVAWSLEHEVVFYALAGLACIVFGLSVSGLLALLVVFSAVGVLNHVLLPTPIWDFHLFSLYQIEFAAGLAVFLFQDRLSRLKPLFMLALGFIGFALTVTIAQSMPGPITNLGVDRAGSTGLFLVLGLAFFSACILIGLLNAERNGVFLAGGRVWKATVATLVLIGDASYALYLFHPTAYGVIGKAYSFLDIPDILLLPSLLAAIVLTTVASIIWLVLVERPLLSTAHKFLQTRGRGGRLRRSA